MDPSRSGFSREVAGLLVVFKDDIIKDGSVQVRFQYRGYSIPVSAYKMTQSRWIRPGRSGTEVPAHGFDIRQLQIRSYCRRTLHISYLVGVPLDSLSVIKLQLPYLVEVL
jgi:hypothetical protein